MPRSLLPPAFPLPSSHRILILFLLVENATSPAAMGEGAAGPRAAGQAGGGWPGSPARSARSQGPGRGRGRRALWLCRHRHPGAAAAAPVGPGGSGARSPAAPIVWRPARGPGGRPAFPAHVARWGWPCWFPPSRRAGRRGAAPPAAGKGRAPAALCPGGPGKGTAVSERGIGKSQMRCWGSRDSSPAGETRQTKSSLADCVIFYSRGVRFFFSFQTFRDNSVLLFFIFQVISHVHGIMVGLTNVAPARTSIMSWSSWK